jgi:hypothetical protein
LKLWAGDQNGALWVATDSFAGTAIYTDKRDCNGKGKKEAKLDEVNDE